MFTIQCSAQRPVNPPAQGPPNMRGETVPNGEPEDSRATQEMRKKANLERQAAIKNDTDKLLRLAQELKQSVDKSSANVLSLDVVKKAEEIEKLAHSVKDRMRGPN
jgi:hypothetical protein